MSVTKPATGSKTVWIGLREEVNKEAVFTTDAPNLLLRSQFGATLFRNGEPIGKIDDIMIDLESGNIVDYLIVPINQNL